ncbi:MAG: hypothetical protein IT178_18875, partial [Acidobacteria bacterium]|nr:hypothetical protein [Acidobacteriota bacterium]
MNLTHIRFSGSPAASALSPDVTASPPRQPNTREGTLGPLPALVLANAGLDVSAYRPAPLQRRTSA